MKLVFWSRDTISTISKTLLKVPTYKKVTVEIDPSHLIFEHERRGTYFRELIEENHIQATFLASNNKSKRYFERAGLPFISQFSNFREKWNHESHQVRKKAKTLHQDMLVKKNSMSVFLMIAEFGLLCLALYTFWTLISPNAVITLTPQYSIDSFVYNFRYYPAENTDSQKFHAEKEFLSIPMAREVLPYSYDMSINVGNSTYEIENAVWYVRVENSLPYPFSLLPNTKFVIDEDIIYTSKERAEIPAWREDKPGTAVIEVTANSHRENGVPIWSDGNIPKDSELLIKNLSESTIDRKLLAYSTRDFTGGDTITRGTVIQDDIDKIEQKIIDAMESNKEEFITGIYRDPAYIAMPFDEMFDLDIQEFLTTSTVWDTVSLIDGKVNSNLAFRSITRDDLEDGIYTFLDQRDPNVKRQYDINKDSVTFYDPIRVEEEELGIYYFLIPTKVEMIHHYDFVIDPYQITLEMKDKIVGKSKQEALEIVKQYKEVGNVNIRISPSRFTLIPSSKSRITFREAE